MNELVNKQKEWKTVIKKTNLLKMEEERDLSTFDKNVIELFDLSKEILKVSEKRKLSLSDRRNPFATRLERYIKTYNKTDPEEHVGYFEKIYTNNKRFILLGPQRDAWLSDNSIVISYGEEAGVKTEIKVHLSSIYNNACKTRDEVKEELEGLPDSSDPYETRFPTRFMLFLYRIFREVSISDNEKTKLTSHIETLESETGMRSSRGGNGDDPLSGLFDMTSNMVEQFTGSKVPKDQMPGKNEIGKMFGNLVNDPKTKSMIGNVMQQLQGTNNIGEMATKLVGALGNQEGMGDLMKNMTGGNNETSEITSEITNSNTNTEADGDVNDEFSDY